VQELPGAHPMPHRASEPKQVGTAAAQAKLHPPTLNEQVVPRWHPPPQEAFEKHWGAQA
jgi:hypothetical protein